MMVNSGDLDKMPNAVPSHLGLHCQCPIWEVRLEKTCLRGFQPGKGLNQPALLQRLTRILKFFMQHVQLLYFPVSEQ